MWTNVFRIGGLHHISWFQFLPHESELNPLPDKSVKLEQKDAATLLVLFSHLQLQKEGFLSAWTNSFVGPWDPSQGLHNPDEKIKLWLFLPGRHSSLVETAQAAVSRLRVVASGLWLAPGDSEEVAAALSQALRNCIERALNGLSYIRFGDVFSKHHLFQSEEFSRRGQPTIEFIFAANEEAIFVHARISAKYIRAVSSGDMERMSKHSSNSFSYRLPVIVGPHGMRGRLTGYCPNDLIKQVYFSSSKFRMSNGLVGLPYHVSQSSSCQLRGQDCYVEVTLGCPVSASEKPSQSSSTSVRSLTKHPVAECPPAAKGDKGSTDYLSVYEKTFIYPAEAILIPVLQTSGPRSSLRRFWLQNWIGPSWAGSSYFMHCAGDIDAMEDSWIEINGMRVQHGYSSSNSNSSSMSSTSSSSSDSDYIMTSGAGDLEADADSLTCRQSGLSSNYQLENDRHKLGSKRPRSGMAESFGQVGTVVNPPIHDVDKSDFGSMEVNNSAITGVATEQIGSHWDWDDDDRGLGMDIQALLSEFGDFGDFFENDALPFGEPPGTAESQALVFSGPECGDMMSSPIGVTDITDQMLVPVGFPSFETYPLLPAATEEGLSKNQEPAESTMISGPVNQTPVSSTSEFDHLVKTEALMTFAPEYGAVETPRSEGSLSIFRSPYVPKSHKVESSNSSPNNYIYSATPPLSPCLNGSDDKSALPTNPKTYPGRHDTTSSLQSKMYYTYVESGKEQHDKRSATHNDRNTTGEGLAQSPFSTFNLANAVKSVQKTMAEGILGTQHILPSVKNVLATQVECIMFQASMCRVRHVLLSSSAPVPTSLNRFRRGSVMNQLSGDVSTMTDNVTGRFEVKKKESIPVRIAGDVDGGIIDGHLNAPVGVWRSVGGAKVSKIINLPNIEVSPSLPHSSFNEEGLLSYGQRHPLLELLDSMAFLVQQATSFVDLALDADCCDGPYGWLAVQEHWRREFSCGPSMVHAGCGGTLASCHFLDIAGAELVDPLSADIHASSVISLLQSEIKTALKSAFSVVDGPLTVIDWCKGRSPSGDGGATIDGSSAESALSESKDSSSTVTLSIVEPMSPSQSSAGGSSGLKVSMVDGAKADEISQRKLSQELLSTESEQHLCSRLRPMLFVLPSPSILVGYQDDWLKTSPTSLQFWEKAPLEPYALQKPIIYGVVCPDINPLTSAAADFFQQLGTVYETCKLGTHSPQSLGNQMDIDSGKLSSSGFVLLDCPQSIKIESTNASLVGSISDYFLSLSNGWDLASYLKSLSKALKAFKSNLCLSTNQKEGNSGPCTVIYVVCPFPEPVAVLQTVVESSVAVGSIILPPDREKRSMLHSQIGKALSCSAAVDEASLSNTLVLSGFSVPKLVLQIVTVDAIFRVTSPGLNELVVLKETAFTVYNKARRISRGSSNEVVQSSSLSIRSHSMLTQMTSIPGMWKDCVGSRITGSSLQREGEIDASLRPGVWENAWQTRSGGLSCDANRNGELLPPDETCYMFEPLFILAEPGSADHGASPMLSGNLTSDVLKLISDDTSGSFMQSASSMGGVDPGSSTQVDGSEPGGFGSSGPPSLHCCYGWTEDWRWLVCIWTDARGELLDSHIFPFGGISSRQDTKGLQCLFVQVLQQGCQILQACSSSDSSGPKPRDFVITRIGSFFELEYLEWQKAIYSVGGSEVKKWPVQLRRSVPDGIPSNSNGASLQQQEMSIIQERTLPSSPSPLYSKASGFVKSGLAQSTSRKQLMGGHTAVDNSRGLLQWVQSISFVTISMDHSLHLVQADSPPSGAQVGNTMGPFGYLERFTAVKSLGSTLASYVFIPSPSMRFLPPTPLQLPTCLTAESPPLAHLLHSKGSAIPLSTAFVVSKAVPSMRKDYKANLKDEWPSVLSVGLIDFYGHNIAQEKVMRGNTKPGARTSNSDARDIELEAHLVLESIAAELHALSWMTVSPAYLERRTALPFHCDMVLRLRRLLHFADKELSRQPDKSQV